MFIGYIHVYSEGYKQWQVTNFPPRVRIRSSILDPLATVGDFLSSYVWQCRLSERCRALEYCRTETFWIWNLSLLLLITLHRNCFTYTWYGSVDTQTDTQIHRHTETDLNTMEVKVRWILWTDKSARESVIASSFNSYFPKNFGNSL